MLKKLEQNKLMIVTGLRISEALNAEVLRVAESTGLSKRDVIRLAIKKGLPAVEKFASEQPNFNYEQKNEQANRRKD